jgi:hypothetical protein
MLEVRPEVAAMAQAQETQLRAHDDRPGWKGESPFALAEHLMEEIVEFYLAVGYAPSALQLCFERHLRRVASRVPVHVGPLAVQREGADVQNMVTMIVDVKGALPSLPPRPRIVCLCGSTRFWRTFQQASLQETLAGRIVLSIGAASGTDDEHFGNLDRAEYERVKGMLDELHLRKIDLCDEVLILNVEGYVGESTARELAYARSLGKPVRWWEVPAVEEGLPV